MAYSSPHLMKTSQLSIAIESTEGTEIAFGDSGAAAHVWADAVEHEHTEAAQRHDRGHVPGTLTPRPKAMGGTMGTITCRAPCTGLPLASGSPFFARALQAMGLLATAIKSIATDGMSPAGFAEGALIGNNASLGSATKTARVVYTSGDTVYYVPLAGDAFSDADTLYDDAGTQNSADVTTSATPADKGYRYTPLTERTNAAGVQKAKTVTTERRIAGRRHTLAGARGRGGLTINAGEPVMLRFEAQGPRITSGGAPRPGALIAPGTLPAVPVPDVVRGASLTLTPAGGSVYQPVLHQLEIDIASAIGDRPSIGGGVVGDTGYAVPNIGDRPISVTIEPESQPASFDADLISQAGTTIVLEARVGSLAGANGLLIVRCPALQIDDDRSKGDRDGRVTEPMRLMATGTDDDELVIDHLAEPA